MPQSFLITYLLGGTNPSWLSINSSGQLIYEGGVSAWTADLIQVGCYIWETTSLPATIDRTLVPLPSYSPGQTITDDNGNIQQCVTGGQVAATHPVWKTTIIGNVVDGTVTWTFNMPVSGGVGTGYGLPKFYNVTAVP